MTEKKSDMECPASGRPLDEGFVSCCSGAVWHPTKPRGWQRAFWSAYSSGSPVFGSLLSYPVVSSVRAEHCAGCGAVVITGEG
jgi:hypothetical protein